jgi:hypothetical protein
LKLQDSSSDLELRDSFFGQSGKGKGKPGSHREHRDPGLVALSPSPGQGILPLTKSSFEVQNGLGSVVLLEKGAGYRLQTAQISEWNLPGHGESYSDCGSWRFRGCLHVEDHLQDGLLEDHVGKAYVEMYRKSCARPECPVCYEKWAGKEAQKIARRLSAVGKSMGRVIHLTVSPAQEDVFNLTFEQLRAKAYSIVKKNGFLGGSCIFHPWREDDRGFWYFSPHFHMIGYGWIHGTSEGYQQHGWIVKNLRVRETVSGTALYQLSHCGIHEKYHSVTWFGRLSYNKLRVPFSREEKHHCPLCGAELIQLLYVGREEDLPDRQDGSGFWLDPQLFMAKGRWDSG